MVVRCVLILLMFACTTLATPYSAFRDGEQFTYRVSWGIFSKAGEIKIRSIRGTYEGKPVFRITVLTSSKGFVRGLFDYQDTAEAFIDAETGKILKATDVAQNGERSTDAVTVFDYAKRIAKHEDKARPGRNCEIRIPDGDAVDLISALVQTRDWAKEPGVQRDALVFAGRDIYPVTITAERVERIRGPKGELDALLLVPRMSKNPVRGIFKKGGEIRVWISRDGTQLPVRMQLKLNFGTAALHLVDHSIAPVEG